MFKKIPGNRDYLINLRNEIINSYSKVVILERHPMEKISIELFGKTLSVRKDHLSLISWYELGYIHNLSEHLDKIIFCPCTNKVLKVNCRYLLSFSEPLYYREGFRYIPNFSRYAINIDGDVLDTFTNTIVTKREIDSDGYDVVYIYNPDRVANRWTRVHRLLGFAWLPNTNFEEKPFINHIDGNKLNNSLENLEWCNQAENTIHALNMGLLGTNVKMKSRDFYTGQVVTYNSVSEMAEKLAMPNVSAANLINKLPGYLFQKRYEIKLLADDSPWFYEAVENADIEPSKAIYTITVTDPETGELKSYNNVKAFYKAYGLWSKTGTLNDGVAAFREKYPNSEISYKRNSVIGPYRIIEVETKRIILFDSIAKAAAHMGISRTELQYDLSRRLTFIYSKKWIVVPGFNDFIFEDYKDKPKPFSSIVITKDDDGSEMVAKSLKHASKITGIDPRSVAKYLDTGVSFKGLKFRPLEQ